MRRLPQAAVVACLLAGAGSSAADLIALYKFDATTGDAAADSVTGNDASWIGSSSSSPDWTTGIIGGSVDLPGTGNHQNYFRIDSLPQLVGTPAGMTISVWVRPEGDSGYRGVLMSRNVSPGGTSFGLAHEDTRFDGRVANTATDTANQSAVADGSWYHVAWVWDNAARKQQIFINGSAATAPTTVNAQQVTSSTDWRIGDDECCNGRIFDGRIDDLAVFDEPLSANEISTLYANGLLGFSADEEPPPPPTVPLNVGLVINEIHHDADPKTEPSEFIELLNTGPDPVDISGYRIGGTGFTFPAGTTLAVAEYVVVSEIPGSQFRYPGRLSSSGERITLFDASGAVVDRVDYRSEFPWPIVEDGASMQLVNATVDNDLGGAWRPAFPTPGRQNSVFAENAPPQLRQVEHSPEQPTAGDPLTVRVKATDPDGVATVTLEYQTNAPGEFVPAFLPLSSPVLRSSPATPLAPNPAFEQGWQTLPMVPDATGEVFTATIPAQPHRTLIRYRITAADAAGAGIRAPFDEDPSLNFAAFSYDGVPDFVADDGTTTPASTLTSLPVYHLITDADHLAQCIGYDPSDRAGSVASRKKFNWEGAFVYEGRVYDHVEYRLRQRNDRYGGRGRRSFKFRFPRGNGFAARDPEGNRYPARWRRMNTGKMTRFAEPINFGMRELVSSRLWNLGGVLAPEFQHVHFRIIDEAEEAADEHTGDFHGLMVVFEDVDARFVDNRGMEPGNIYKLKDGERNPFELQKFQAREAVTDASDFTTIRDGLNPLLSQTDAWLRQHVDWDRWYLYAALGEGFRHFDYSPAAQKNRIWYFRPDPANPLGKMSIIPHDTDATWRRGTNDAEFDDPRWASGPPPNRGRVVGFDLPKAAIAEITGLDGTDGLNHPERTPFMLEYRNVLREVHDLLWQPETVDAIIDLEAARIAPFEAADRARWEGGPASAGADDYRNTIASQAAGMKTQAFTEDLYMGESLTGGRKERLRRLAEDPMIPATPSIGSGGSPFAPGGFTLTSTTFSDPDGDATFAAMEWRISETDPPPPPPDVLLPAGATWKYLDDGTDQGTAWRAPGFDDSAWASGPAPAGYGTITGTQIATPIDFGTDPADKHITTYFRTTFTVTDPAAFGSITAALNVDDGAAVYINGQEVLRDGFSGATAIGFDTRAETNANEGVYDEFRLGTAALVAGTNHLAVEVHQRSPSSSDLVFDLSLTAAPAPTSAPKHEWIPSWESGELTAFSTSITPPPTAVRTGRTYRARVRHQDTSGRWSHWSAPLVFTATEPDISLYTGALVISEFDYHPATPTAAEIAAGFDDDDLFEFIELRNVSAQALDLSGVRFTKGIDIDLSGTIAPGATALVVNDRDAFEFRHGTGQPVIGEWSGKLSNGGETIKLSFGAGTPIREFTYDDTEPWPAAADGSGSALTLIDPLAVPDHRSPFSWRATAATPAEAGTSTFPGGDLFSYAFSGGDAGGITQNADGTLTLVLGRNLAAEDLVYSLELSDDLTTWDEVPFTMTRTSITTTSPVQAPRRFARVRAETR